ncbi:MAG: rhomboid family intramembrane serine protease [candidate division Zixibacteria bacterium]|nr:rhomboid family intramembrane serine protease [candidate division Zixibacteria bacterium]
MFRQTKLRFGGGTLPPMIKYLLLANVGVYLLQLLAPPSFTRLLGLVPALVKNNLFIWQFFTYMFLHGGFWHILFNMFALWMFGSDIERAWGGREFLKYYLLCGFGAGVLNFLFSINSPVPVIGASGAVYGILVAYAMLFPNRVIYLYMLFPIKAKYLVMGFAIIEFLSTMQQAGDGVAHFAHLGGMLVGFLYLKSDWRFKLPSWKPKSFASKVTHKKKSRRTKSEEDILDKVDSILDKINKVGYHNLSDEEKKVLSDASQILSERKD